MKSDPIQKRVSVRAQVARLAVAVGLAVPVGLPGLLGLLGLSGLAGGLSGCGQRGPLYMPQDASKGKAPTQSLPAKTDTGVQNPPGNDSKPRPPAY